MKKKYCKLNENIELKGKKLFIDNYHLFDCNEDSIMLIQLFIELSNKDITFTEIDIYEKLPKDKKSVNYEKDIRIINNIFSYLIDCHVLLEIVEKVE